MRLVRINSVDPEIGLQASSKASRTAIFAISSFIGIAHGNFLLKPISVQVFKHDLRTVIRPSCMDHVTIKGKEIRR